MMPQAMLSYLSGSAKNMRYTATPKIITFTPITTMMFGMVLAGRWVGPRGLCAGFDAEFRKVEF